MKALISTTEVFTHRWISSWEYNELNKIWHPIYSEIDECQRVAQVEPDNNTFLTHESLIWLDCPDNCVMDEWYFKDGQIIKKPEDVIMPLTPIEIMP